MPRQDGWRIGAALAALVVAAGAGREAAAQQGRYQGNAAGVGTPAPGGMPGTPGLYANPYANPYTNPFLNPYTSQLAYTSPGNAALYFAAAQQANGGIGSGQLSGVRPRPSATAPATPPPPANAVDYRMRAPDGAARYFNRGTQAGARLETYYNRQNSHFNKNVR